MGKYLDFYKNYGPVGKMPCPGLCLNFYKDPLLVEFFADENDPGTYWAYDDNDDHYPHWLYAFNKRVKYKFTPLRQNIVLFLAAMNDEDFNELKDN